ncbi:hypothetical protein [Marinimicrobium locisalis]|uniref:hypothetical protein n=1 Tax=Marinimicrobium locisalis TaxID=546022 RepID=UPI003221E7B6
MNKVVIVAGVVLALLGLTALVLKPDEPQPAAVTSESSNSSSAVASVSDPLPVNAPTPATRTTAGGAGALALPATPEAPPRQPEVELWQLNKNAPDTQVDGHPAKRLRTDPALVQQFHVGQKLHMYIPQRDMDVAARLESTRNQSANVHIFQGKLLNGDEQGNLTVARGKIQTHLTISTPSGTYSAVIDNKTGETVLTDEGDITVNQVPFEDGIAVPPIEQGPPPSGG